jgi:8-oxo-dGTP pyrophosphatase MutT (NUDIX family)/phosphohistidine phosphatase SixA
MPTTSGALPWRIGPDEALEVLLVHRRNQDDWSIPKGKAEAGETDPECALREVREETGLDCRLGLELPHVVYLDRKRRKKTIRYWAVTAEAGVFSANDEVDVVRWCPLPTALRMLTKPRERPIVLALGSALNRQLGIRPVQARERMLLLVRGAAATPREQWIHSDMTRPLAQDGQTTASILGNLGLFFKIDRIVSAPATRCIETVAPLAGRESLTLEVSHGLADGGTPEAMGLVKDARGTGTVLCTHEDVVDGILTGLASSDRTDLEVRLRQRRGSVWAITGDSARYTAAYYIPMPETEL